MSSYRIASAPNTTIATSTTETAMPSVTGGAIRNLVGFSSFPAGDYDGKLFRLKCFIKLLTGGTNLTTKVYWNSGANTNLTTFTSDVVIANVIFNSASSPSLFAFIIDLTWEKRVGVLEGYYFAQATSASSTWAALDANPTSAALTTLNFFATTTNSVNGATAALVNFTLEQI